MFSREFCEIFYNTYFVRDYHMPYKVDVLKNLAKFTAKSMWAVGFGISENKTCLADSKFIDILQNLLYLRSVFNVSI